MSWTHPGVGRLYIAGQHVGEGKVELTMPVMFGIAAAVTVGHESGSPICGLYPPPFPFTGTLHTVRVEVGSEHITSEDDEAQMRIAMARQ